MVDLGKYAYAVLMSYGVSIVLLLGLIGVSIASQRRVRAEIKELENR